MGNSRAELEMLTLAQLEQKREDDFNGAVNEIVERCEWHLRNRVTYSSMERFESKLSNGVTINGLLGERETEFRNIQVYAPENTNLLRKVFDLALKLLLPGEWQESIIVASIDDAFRKEQLIQQLEFDERKLG